MPLARLGTRLAVRRHQDGFLLRAVDMRLGCHLQRQSGRFREPRKDRHVAVNLRLILGGPGGEVSLRMNRSSAIVVARDGEQRRRRGSGCLKPQMRSYWWAIGSV